VLVRTAIVWTAPGQGDDGSIAGGVRFLSFFSVIFPVANGNDSRL